MPEGRPEIPAELKRSVLVESGHRCAIPTCRQTPVELAHIVPWAKVKQHTFDNLIALCPTCHTRFDRGDIDRKAMVQYKANLETLNHRYTDLERQLLRALVRRWQDTKKRAQELQNGIDGWLLKRAQDRRDTGWSPEQIRLQDMTEMAMSTRIRIYGPMAWAFTNLLDDGLIEFRDDRNHAIPIKNESEVNSEQVELTEKGCEFVLHWIAAQPLDPAEPDTNSTTPDRQSMPQLEPDQWFPLRPEPYRRSTIRPEPEHRPTLRRRLRRQ